MFYTLSCVCVCVCVVIVMCSTAPLLNDIQSVKTHSGSHQSFPSLRPRLSELIWHIMPIKQKPKIVVVVNGLVSLYAAVFGILHKINNYFINIWLLLYVECRGWRALYNVHSRDGHETSLAETETVTLAETETVILASPTKMRRLQLSRRHVVIMQ